MQFMLSKTKTNTLHMRGFTLIELMIVVAIIGLIAVVAFPSYQEQTRGARRTDGTVALMEARQAMERFYSKNYTYAGATVGTAANSTILPTAPRTGAASYTLALSGLSAIAFTITASPTGAQASDSCGNLGIDQAGVKTITGSGVAVTDCWR